MLSCPDAQKKIWPFLEGKLSPKETEQFLDHMESCGACHEELEIYHDVYNTIMMEEGSTLLKPVGLEKMMADTRRKLRRERRKKGLRRSLTAVAALFACAAVVIGLNLFDSRSSYHELKSFVHRARTSGRKGGPGPQGAAESESETMPQEKESFSE